MQHEQTVTRSFAPRAQAYRDSAVHSQGDDLALLGKLVATMGSPSVLDLGCGAGHASFAVAPFASRVVAYDLAKPMLDVVAEEARERQMENIEVVQGSVDRLPFEDSSFECITSRYSAHHWHNVPLALSEARRTLRPGGQVCFIDVLGGPIPLLDTHLQALELLRDPSHVRNYTAPEWITHFEGASLDATLKHSWRLQIDFAAWIARIGTAEDRVAAIRSLWSGAPEEARDYYKLRDDLSFELDVAMFQVQT